MLPVGLSETQKKQKKGYVALRTHIDINILQEKPAEDFIVHRSTTKGFVHGATRGRRVIETPPCSTAEYSLRTELSDNPTVIGGENPNEVISWKMLDSVMKHRVQEIC